MISNLKKKGVSPTPNPIPWVRKIPQRRAQQSTPVFLPGESHGQRSLAGYSPWGCKESDTIERLSTQHISFGRVFNQLRDCLIKPTFLHCSCPVSSWIEASILAGHPATSARHREMSLGLRWVVSEGKSAELSSQVYRMLRFQRGKWDVHLNPYLLQQHR